ncbi:hypothetical protein HAX54_011640 [Datura stramonium]|uniref:Uncharacterized protein n=1 Tax=Datura stramonium TaxID=4076 RepID=A0ABS8TK97_DATST|nr:hypothetical protein [Datura stramonium]
MFDIFFGWRKASKCKNLIKRVQCRLKLLKNKRSCIIRQLKDDLCELLRNGHYQIVIDRVEQLWLDERKVAVYDLLENYCEFIIINLPYIRRHKDCPNDINEAVSSLIFASARLGDLPELGTIRKLFGERYGQRFEKSALQLLPGNLVSHQIMDNICTTSVSEEEKYSLVDEIARSCFQQGPLLLEYRRESQDELVNEISNAAADYKEDGQLRLKDPKITDKKLLKDPSDSHQQLPTANSTCLSTTKTIKDSENCLKHNGNYGVLDSERVIGSGKGNISAFISEQNEERRAAESSTEDSAELPEQMIYLDDIQEFESAVKKDVSFQDQRLFMFKAPFVPLRLKIDTGSNFEGIEKKTESQNAKERPKSSRKNNTISGKRTRKKSVSVVSDTDSTIYYGDLLESSPESKPKRQIRRRSSRKSSVEENQKSYHTFAHDSKDHPCYVKFRSTLTFVKCIDDHSKSTCNSRCNGPMENNCSLEHPCYYWITDEKGSEESPLRVPRRRVKATKDFSKCHCSCQLVLPPQQIAKINQNVESVRDHSVKPCTEDVSESQETCNSLMSSTSRMTYQRARKENQAPYLRAMTMPPERPKDNFTDNFHRSSSFPVQEPGSGSSENRHVHPKLPDYDEIAATFLALKKEKLQKKC